MSFSCVSQATLILTMFNVSLEFYWFHLLFLSSIGDVNILKIDSKHILQCLCMKRDKGGSGVIQRKDFCVSIDTVPWCSLWDLAKGEQDTLLLSGYFLHSLLAPVLWTVYTGVLPYLVLPSVLSVTRGQP